ncbi:hypothetical protein [Steroidobacter agaridevorans]|uniref:hypothetical protein n=1 Tax=Steroidobacter agaridevorans TaxID=2695856 RepID=UPI00137AF0C1|nr:hypothetical protein [Steroidobacter agaridevorans]
MRSTSFLPSRNHTRFKSANLWSSEELGLLRSLASRGVPVSSIASTLRRSESSIKNKAGMHGIPLRQASAD